VGEARQHPPHRLVVRRDAEGEIRGLVLAGASVALGALCESPIRTRRLAGISPSMADCRSLRIIASNLVIVSTVSPRLTFTRRAASFMKISFAVGWPFVRPAG